MGFHDFYYFLGVRTAIRPEAVNGDVLSLQPFKEPFQYVLLVEVYIGAPVHRLYTDNHVLNNSDSDTYPKDFL